MFVSCRVLKDCRDADYDILYRILRTGHLPLLIPWRALHDAQPCSFRWLPAPRFDVVAPISDRRMSTLVLPPEIVAELPGFIPHGEGEPRPEWSQSRD
jgi:hypothetical protein